MNRSRLSTLKWLPLVLAGVYWAHVAPAGAAPAEISRAEALTALASADAGERRRGALGLAARGLMDDAPVLVAALRDDDELVRVIAGEALWAVWSRSGDADVDDLLKEGIAQMVGGRLPEAIGTFSRVIERRPDFAEGWNKRATAYFLAGEYRRSLHDCDEVIKRNPLHFGALSGYGQIYLQLDEPEKALEYLRRALAINPNLDGVESAIEKLEALAVRRRRAI